MLRTKSSAGLSSGAVAARCRTASATAVELLTRQLIERARLAVVYGGDKAVDGAVLRRTRNPRSWKSYQAVAGDIAAALGRLGCRQIHLLPDDMRLGERLDGSRINMVWLNSGGVQGHSSIAHAAAMLEMMGIAYVGHDPLNAAVLDNKFFFKRQLMAMGLPTAPFVVWHPGEGRMDPASERRFVQTFRSWDGGFIVKPVTGRASLHVHYVERAQDLAAVAHDVFALTQNHVLIEAYLSGREYCIAVCGPIISRSGRLERLAGPFAFSGVERVHGAGEHVFTSMDAVPITQDRVRPLDPALDGLVLDTLEDLASTLFTELPLRTLVRLDVRADHNGRLLVLEANPKPDLKAPEGRTTSLICAGLERDGMTYDDLILSILANRAAELLDSGAGITESLSTILDR